MAKRKTTTKKPVEPVIEYVDPETNLKMQTPIDAVDKAPETALQSQVEPSPYTATQLSVFDVLQRRMERESAM